MGSADVNFDLNKRGERQRGEHQGVDVSMDADALLLNEKLISFKYFMRVSLIIALPVLTCLTVYNILIDRIVAVVLLCSMGILFLWAYFVIRKSESKHLAPEQNYRIYQNAIRGFLLFFLILISYTAGWTGDLDRVLWSYIFPIGAFLYLSRREAFCWTFFFLAVMVLILFYSHPKNPSLEAFQSFKFIYLMSFSAMCAIGIAGKYAIEFTYARFVDREIQLVESEKQYREAYKDLQREMSQRQQVQQDLAESEEKYRLLFENSVDVIYSIDREFRTIDVSPSIKETLGYAPSELVGRPIKELGLLAPESLESAFSDIIRVLEGTPVRRASYTFIARDESRRYGEISGAPIYRKGEVVGVILVARDITDRKQVEENLKVSEMKCRDILENIDDACFELDLKGNITFFNDSTCHLSGYSASEVMGMNFRQYTSSETAKQLKDFFMNIYATEGKRRLRDFEMIRKDKSTLDMEISVNLIRNPIGEPIGFRCIARDITERRRIEEEKRSLEERLQRSEKMEVLGQLAGRVAHDLNNVLGALSGRSELLLMEVPKEHGAREHAEQILQATEKGAAIIQDLLTLTRRGVAAAEVINLNSVVSGFLKTPVFEKIKDYHPRVTFRTEFDGNPLNIKGSPVHLEKTLMNLVSNAAEAIPGEGEVTIRTESRYLEKPIHGYDEVNEGDYAVLTVSDTGMGIPTENREKIFEPFYTKKTMGRSGTGLGLAIVWGTVKDHNGYIDVQTAVGEGTTFTLYLPVTREELIAQQPKVPIEQYMGNGESVLVVDDIAEQRDVAAALLTKMGYKVHVVSSGEDAIEYLKENKADILLLDMIMAPGIDGLETYQRVQEINPKQKAIIVSGFSETERVGEAEKLGVGAYVRKPYIMEKIGLAVRAELDC